VQDGDVKRAALAVMLACGCATTAPVPESARATAPIGRLAGAPATLRRGVVTYGDLPAARPDAPPMHHHHGAK
jgi:hypothetical protein